MASNAILTPFSTRALHSVVNNGLKLACRKRPTPQPTRCNFRCLRQPIVTQTRFKSSTANSHDGPNKIYTFEEVQSLTASPSANRILIDVREPFELKSTGRIPGAQNLPINSSPDGLFLPGEDFEDKFGFPKPRASDEIIFYCKAGVRSRSAAELARMAGWEKVGEYPGSWKEWKQRGGKAEE